MTNDIVLTGRNAVILAPVAASGEDAVRRFIEFFNATIRRVVLYLQHDGTLEAPYRYPGGIHVPHDHGSA